MPAIHDSRVQLYFGRTIQPPSTVCAWRVPCLTELNGAAVDTQGNLIQRLNHTVVQQGTDRITSA
jgi:hypothetical protein